MRSAVLESPITRTKPATFGAALRLARESRKMTLDALGRQLGLTGARVQQWESGDAPPAPDRVFEIERVLGLDPGDLSVLLGYLPLGVAPGVRAAINLDPGLSPDSRAFLIAGYEAVVERPKNRRR